MKFLPIKAKKVFTLPNGLWLIETYKEEIILLRNGEEAGRYKGKDVMFYNDKLGHIELGEFGLTSMMKGKVHIDKDGRECKESEAVTLSECMEHSDYIGFGVIESEIKINKVLRVISGLASGGIIICRISDGLWKGLELDYQDVMISSDGMTCLGRNRFFGGIVIFDNPLL